MKYALALAGGGTRGAFEAGVWKALEELNIKISAIAGTSIGALNGAVFASGADPLPLWENITARDVAVLPEECENMLSASSLMEFARQGLKGGLDTAPLKAFLNKTISIEKLMQSDIDYGLCAFSTSDMKSVELFKENIPPDKLIDYILASACLPIFKPVVIDGVQYSDGGMRNNLPINMLIDRGYDTIISVSVKGIGYVRDADRCGINIIEINCDDPEIGIMEFDNASIKRSVNSGYMECMRVFGRLAGEHYYIETASYNKALLTYGRDILSGVEDAARMLRLDRCGIYTFEELAGKVLEHYTDSRILRRLTGFMDTGRAAFLREKLDWLGDSFRAANAVVYLSKYITEKNN